MATDSSGRTATGVESVGETTAGAAPAPSISFVIPAYNEEAFIGRTLQAIHEAARALGESYEIVVANDNSSDRTAEIAEQAGARVVTAHHRQIAATRNSGARAARGRFIFFVDSDTLPNPRTVGAALKAMREGAAGGGGATWFDRGEKVPLYARVGHAGLLVGAILTGFTGGPFMFCTREAFDATGGFPEKMFWGEETPFAQALKREGKFVVPWTPVRMSGRRYRKSMERNAFVMDPVMKSPGKLFTDRSVVQSAWYDPDRTDTNTVPTSLRDRFSHVVWLLVILCIYVGLVWSFIPWTIPPWPGMLGAVRDGVTIFLAHLGLVLLPIAAGLITNVLRQKKPTNLLRSTLLIAAHLWIGGLSLKTVIETYGRLWGWLAGA